MAEREITSGKSNWRVPSSEDMVADAQARLDERARARQEADRARTEVQAYYDDHKAANDVSGHAKSSGRWRRTLKTRRR